MVSPVSLGQLISCGFINTIAQCLADLPLSDSTNGSGFDLDSSRMPVEYTHSSGKHTPMGHPIACITCAYRVTRLHPNCSCRKGSDLGKVTFRGVPGCSLYSSNLALDGERCTSLHLIRRRTARVLSDSLCNALIRFPTGFESRYT
jgi:hypothetical protein